MTASSGTQEADGERNHLDDLADGCGCTEVWEYLSERRGEDE